MLSIGNIGSEKLEDSAVDMNAASTTTPIETSDRVYVGLFVANVSGTSATHVTTVQISADNVNWFDTSCTITGEGASEGMLLIGEWVRAKVTTVEGAASTADITIVIK